MYGIGALIPDWMHASGPPARIGRMNGSHRGIAALFLAAALVGCSAPGSTAAPSVEPSPSAAATPHEMSTMSAAPASSDHEGHDMGSADATPHDMGGMARPGQTVTVDIANFAFEPVEIRIPVGTEVVFTNLDTAPHTATAGSDASPMPEVFDSGLLQQGETFSFVFEEAGTYDYYCERHPPMVGRIVVEG